MRFEIHPGHSQNEVPSPRFGYQSLKLKLFLPHVINVLTIIILILNSLFMLNMSQNRLKTLGNNIKTKIINKLRNLFLRVKPMVYPRNISRYHALIFGFIIFSFGIFLGAMIQNSLFDSKFSDPDPIKLSLNENKTIDFHKILDPTRKVNKLGIQIVINYTFNTHEWIEIAFSKEPVKFVELDNNIPNINNTKAMYEPIIVSYFDAIDKNDSVLFEKDWTPSNFPEVNNCNYLVIKYRSTAPSHRKLFFKVTVDIVYQPRITDFSQWNVFSIISTSATVMIIIPELFNLFKERDKAKNSSFHQFLWMLIEDLVCNPKKVKFDIDLIDKEEFQKFFGIFVEKKEDLMILRAYNWSFHFNNDFYQISINNEKFSVNFKHELLDERTPEKIEEFSNIFWEMFNYFQKKIALKYRRIKSSKFYTKPQISNLIIERNS